VERKRISSGSTFERDIGYSRAIVAGDWVFVSGTTGFDYSKMVISDDIVEQTEQALQNVASALRQGWPVLRKHFGEVRPAATMFEAKLADPRIRIEIEVTALKRA
jgi:enamine deaminase RidA (YjgF/YER057c/UK114 family)